MFPLNPLAELLVLALWGFAGWAEARRLRSRHGVTLDDALRRAPHLAAGAALLLLMSTMEVTLVALPELSWYLPVPVEYAYSAIVEAVVLSVGGFTSAVTVTIAFATRHPRRLLLCAPPAALLIGVPVLLHWLLEPIHPTVGNRERDGVIMQSTPYTCAPASAANLLRALGVHRSEREVAELFGTTALGTSSAQIIRGMAELDIHCRRADLGRRPLPVAPAILLFEGARVGHAVALLEGDHEGGLVIADPLVGRTATTEARLRAERRIRAIECARP